MKVLLTLLLALTIGLVHAQVADSVQLHIDPATHRLTYTEVVQMPGVSQADLHARAQDWLATAYQTKPAATPAPAQVSGTVRGTGWREIEMLAGGLRSTPLNLWYTITIDVQPGRYTYVITEFRIQSEPIATDTAPEKQPIELVMSNEKVKPTQTDYRGQVTDVARVIGATIKANMLKPKAGKS